MRWSAVILLVALSLSPACARAQDTIPVRVTAALPNGSFEVLVRGDTMVAITRRAMQRMLAMQSDLVAARREGEVKDSLIQRYEIAAQWYDSTLTRKRLLIAQCDTLSRGWRDVADIYRRLAAEPWLTFDGGLGATGQDHKPAILAGVGIRRVRIWGFLQEANAGGAVGVSLRLF